MYSIYITLVTYRYDCHGQAVGDEYVVPVEQTCTFLGSKQPDRITFSVRPSVNTEPLERKRERDF